MHYIYKITNLVNDKVYIGQGKNANHRWSCHKSCTKKVLAGAKLGDNMIQVIHLAMAKYGIDCFKFSILEELETQKKANEREDYWINHYDSLNSGYNCQPGGKVVSGPDHHNYGKPGTMLGKKHTKKTKEKIKQSLLGVKHSEERKKNISKAHLGQKAWNKGTKGIMKTNSGSFKKGQASPNRKLTLEVANQIRKEYANTKTSCAKLAKKYNTNPVSINRIINNKIYNE